MTNKPIHTIRDGALKVTIWQNEKAEGEGFWYEYVPGRTYTDRNDKPKTSHSFSNGDLLRFAELLRLAHHWERKQRIQAREAA